VASFFISALNFCRERFGVGVFLLGLLEVEGAVVQALGEVFLASFLPLSVLFPLALKLFLPMCSDAFQENCERDLRLYLKLFKETSIGVSKYFLKLSAKVPFRAFPVRKKPRNQINRLTYRLFRRPLQFWGAKQLWQQRRCHSNL